MNKWTDKSQCNQGTFQNATILEEEILVAICTENKNATDELTISNEIIMNHFPINVPKKQGKIIKYFLYF